MANNSDDVANYRKIETLLLKATEILRSLFQERWKSTSKISWSDEPACGELLISGIGSKVYESAHKEDKKKLKSGDLNQWDLSLLCKVLTGCICRNCRTKTIKAQNCRISALLDIRNQLAHKAAKSLTTAEFEAMWKRGINIIKVFRPSKKVIKELKNRTAENDTSLIAAEIFNEGNALFTNDDIEGAIKSYSKGISLPGVSNDELAMFYSNRAAAYLKQSSASTISKERAHLARNDSLKITMLKPDWWRGHQRVAQSHFALNEFEYACVHYERALELDNTIDEVRTALHDCRERLKQQQSANLLNPKEVPKFISDVMKKINEDLPKEMRFRQPSELEDILCEKGHPQGFFLTAQRYQNGLNVKQNLEVAATLYSIADSKENAETILKLATRIMKGTGVKQDLKLAMQLLHTGANLTFSSELAVDGSSTHSNPGISECQYALGLNYHSGVVVPRDFKLALKWYNKASENGNAEASNVLGVIYSLGGECVQKDMEKAVVYWRLAVRQKNILATWSLAKYYLNQDEPQEAMKWYKQAKEVKCLEAIVEGEQFKDNVTKSRFRRKRVEREIISWEYRNGLTIGDLGFKSRVQRKDNILYSRVRNRKQNKYEYNPEKKSLDRLFLKLNESITTMQIKEFDKLFHSNYYLWHMIPRSSNKVNINLAAYSVRRCTYISKVVSLELIDEVAYDCIKECFEEVRDLNELSQFDMDTRLCYIIVSRDCLHDTIKIVQESILRYANEVEFYIVYCCLLIEVGEYEHGLLEINEAVRRFRYNCDILYLRADIMQRLQTCEPEKVIEAYKQFLDAAPDDHIKVPEALYGVGYQFAQKSPADMNIVRRYYLNGLEAEKKQLPVFEPYPCNHKHILERILGITDSISSTTTGENIKLKFRSPGPVEVILGHRETKSCYEGHVRRDNKMDGISNPRHLNHNDLNDYQEIFLCDIEKYEVIDYFLVLTIIEDVYYNSSSIYLVVEDKKGDVQPAVIVLTVQENAIKTIQTKGIELGATMTVFNPIFGNQIKYGVPALELYGSEFYISHVDKEWVKKCRVCRHLHCNYTCSRCKNVRYCSLQCQEVDETILKHKKICEWVNPEEEMLVHNRRRIPSRYSSVFDPLFKSDIQEVAPKSCSDSDFSLSAFIVVFGIIIVGYKYLSR